MIIKQCCRQWKVHDVLNNKDITSTIFEGEHLGVDSQPLANVFFATRFNLIEPILCSALWHNDTVFVSIIKPQISIVHMTANIVSVKVICCITIQWVKLIEKQP